MNEKIRKKSLSVKKTQSRNLHRNCNLTPELKSASQWINKNYFKTVLKSSIRLFNCSFSFIGPSFGQFVIKWKWIVATYLESDFLSIQIFQSKSEKYTIVKVFLVIDADCVPKIWNSRIPSTIVNLGKNCAFLIVFSVVTYFMICQKGLPVTNATCFVKLWNVWRTVFKHNV